MQQSVDKEANSRLSLEEKLALAAQLYREYHTRCFWHMKEEIAVTEAILPTIIQGLRTYGGKQGALASARLL
jgi:hypothetical protein